MGDDRVNANHVGSEAEARGGKLARGASYPENPIQEMTLYKIGEVAGVMRYSRRRVRDLIRHGKLRAAWTGDQWRISLKAIRDYYEEIEAEGERHRFNNEPRGGRRALAGFAARMRKGSNVPIAA